MVGKITDQGILFQGWPFFGFKQLIPFELIERIEWLENGSRNSFAIHRAGPRPFLVRGLSPDSARELFSTLQELLNPPLAQSNRALPAQEIERIITALCAQRAARPSVVLGFLLDQAILHQATDIHFEYLHSHYWVRFRIDGILHDLATIPDPIRARLIAYIKNSAGLASYRREVPQEGRLTYPGAGAKPLELRLSIVPAHGEESVVLRLFDVLRGSLDLDHLGFSPRVRRDYGQLLDQPRGLILLSGPSSSGKTTTIYASLQYLMKGLRSGERAVSLEEPIEFPLGCVSQIEVAQHQGLTFDRLLSAVLRQDAEVIVVGEIRDAATAAIALRAALTGHLILSTVHCGNAVEVPRRLVDLGLEPAAVAEALAGVIAQRLVRVICPHCRRARPVSQEERELMRVPASIQTAYLGQGCSHCLNTGYRGRTVIAEVLRVTDEVAEMIRENAPGARISEAAQRGGLPELRQDAWSKVLEGVTSLEEIRRVLR